MYLSHIILFCSSLFFLFSLSCKLHCLFTSESSWRTAIPTCCMFSWVYCWSRKSHFWCICSVPSLTMIGSRLIWNHFSWSISWYFLVTWSNKLKDVAVSYSKSFYPITIENGRGDLKKSQGTSSVQTFYIYIQYLHLCLDTMCSWKAISAVFNNITIMFAVIHQAGLVCANGWHCWQFGLISANHSYPGVMLPCLSWYNHNHFSQTIFSHAVSVE